MMPTTSWPVAYRRQLAAACLGVLHVAASAQSGPHTYPCRGDIDGVASQASLQIEAGGYRTGPFVAGSIRNRSASYSFDGELFGGNLGYVSLVENPGGQRRDRVWIGFSQAGFTLRTEDGAAHTFNCGG